MNKLIWIVLTLLAGAMLPIQAGLNAKLAKAGGSPFHASLISFIIGALSVLIIVTVTKQHFSIAGIKSVPAYAWLGGLLGAFFITMTILSFPRLGPVLTFGLVVAGQLLVSLLLEHFNVLVASAHPINYYRLLGVLLIIAGLVLIRKF